MTGGPQPARVEVLAGAVLQEAEEAGQRIEDRQGLHVDDHLTQILALASEKLLGVRCRFWHKVVVWSSIRDPATLA